MNKQPSSVRGLIVLAWVTGLLVCIAACWYLFTQYQEKKAQRDVAAALQKASEQLDADLAKIKADADAHPFPTIDPVATEPLPITTTPPVTPAQPTRDLLIAPGRYESELPMKPEAGTDVGVNALISFNNQTSRLEVEIFNRFWQPLSRAVLIVQSPSSDRTAQLNIPAGVIVPARGKWTGEISDPFTDQDLTIPRAIKITFTLEPGK